MLSVCELQSGVNRESKPVVPIGENQLARAACMQASYTCVEQNKDTAIRAAKYLFGM